MVEEFYAIDHHGYDRRRVGRALAPLLADDAIGQVWIIVGTEAGLDGYAVGHVGDSLESGGAPACVYQVRIAELVGETSCARPRDRLAGSA